MRFAASIRFLCLTALACMASAALVFAAPIATAPPAGAAVHQTTTSVPAYWLTTSGGGIYAFGGAPNYGSTGGMALNKPIVGMAAAPNGGGYWLVASDGGIFSFGNAHFWGSTGSIKLNQPIVGMTPTPDGNGYWLVASDGGIFAFGDAHFWGSTGNLKLNKPVVGMASTPDGGGYWLVASDGGIFAFGDAAFWGSTGNLKLNQPIISMITGPHGSGYILVAADGGTFSFGTAPFYGSLGGIPLKNPIAAAAATPGDTGYWFTDTTGIVSAFGAASYYGSAPPPIPQPIVAIAEGAGTGAFVGAPFPSGSYGFDVSKFTMNSPTCTTGLPSGLHDIGVVEVDGAVDPNATTPDYPNPCLAAEGQWAGAGLNLYTFLDNVGPSSGALCTDVNSCYQVGYSAGIHAFQDAQAAGLNTNVTWWLDVEDQGTYWTTNTADNAETVMGAIAALHNTEDIADVGVYASPANWNGIVGDYQPSVPYWMAYYLLPTGSGPGDCAAVANFESEYQLPTGPVDLVQYGSPANGSNYDEDYAC
jgi:hypothetical protein